MKTQILILIMFSVLLIAGCTSNNTIVKPEDNQVIFHFIDVSHGRETTHGDAIFIETSDKNMIIDGGEADQAYRVIDYLNKLNITKVDYVVATHAHPDHIDGLVDVMQTYDIGQVWFNGKSNDFSRKEFEPEMKKHNYSFPKKGHKVLLADDVEIEVFLPDSNFTPKDDNEASIVLMLTHDDVKTLFMSDCMKQCHDYIMGLGISLKADILKVGHHCNKDAAQPGFLEAVNPKIAVITPGVRDKWGKPHKECVENINSAGIELYRNDKHGDVAVISNGSNIKVLT